MLIQRVEPFPTVVSPFFDQAEIVLDLFRPFLEKLERRLQDAGFDFHFEIPKPDLKSRGALNRSQHIASAYELRNHGMFPEDVATTIADALLDALSIHIEGLDARPQVYRQVNQSGKSGVEQALAILIPALDYLISGEYIYPVLILPPLAKHALQVATELQIRTALLSCVLVSYNGSNLKPLKHFYELGTVSKIIVRTPR
jgi:hypothetical protein